MKEFMFLMQGDDSKQVSPEQMQQRMQHYMEWMQRMTAEGRYKAGQPLEPGGQLLKRDGTLVTDGPFLEPKEMIGGYVILRAKDLAEATDIARGCPLLHHCEILIRPLVQLPA